MKRTLSTLCAVLVLGGCAATDDPIYQSLTRDFETEVVKDVTESYRIGWLAQGLLEPPVRKELGNLLVGNAQKIQSQFSRNMEVADDLGTTAQFLTDVGLGQFGSSAGSDAGTLVFAGLATASLFMGDGSMDHASGIFLPSTWKGEPLTTQAQAQAASNELIDAQIKYAADQVGFDASCEYACDAFPSMYRLKVRPDTDLSKYIYAPRDIAIYVNKTTIIPAGDTAGLDSLATGIPVAWRTEYGNMAPMVLAAEPVKKQGTNEIDIVATENGGWTFSGKTSLSRTDFGDAFLRAFHSTPFTIYGTTEGHPNSVYYNGKRYKFVLNSRADTFDETVLK